MIQVIAYLLAVTIAETITVIFQPLWGVAGHVLILAGLIIHSALARESPYRQLFLSMALVPLVRILSLSMPLVNIPRIWWEPIIYAPLLVAALEAARILGYKLVDLGLNFKMPLVQVAVTLAGVGFGIVEYLVLRPEGRVAELTVEELWLPVLIFVFAIGFVEEFIFRGVMQRAAVKALGWWGIVYVSLLFAVLHMGFLSWLDVVFVFVIALFFGWVVNKTGSLIGVTLSHGLTNIMLFLIAPLLF